MPFTTLTSLGWNDWFQSRLLNSLEGGLSVVRVVEVNKNGYRVSNGEREMDAEVSGRFRFGAVRSVDLPAVGDWAAVQPVDNGSFAVIHSLLERKTLLKRKEPGRRVDFQPIAANIDFGMVMQPADQFNVNLLDRYLVMLNEGEIEPLVVVNKTDLVSAEALGEVRAAVAKKNCRAQFISATGGNGVDELAGNLLPGKTYCLLGKSGVGKSSLLNALLHKNLLRVNDIREKDGRGRHTTVRRQLIRLDAGSIFIDTPGMRELGNFDVGAGIERTFEELLSHADGCRFRDCTHTHEAGCAVVRAVQEGAIDAERYENWLKLRKEAAFYELSYAEKRKKDKSFGKMKNNYDKFTRKK
jgi:ribosome biogenesis GTPase / thiamine phosphate phosphatase